MILQEYDEDLHIRNEKEISFQDGYEKGCRDAEDKVLAEKQRADNLNILNKILMLKLKGKCDEEIADTLHLPLETVHQALDNM
ncbi:MAG: hypothetical protein MRZ60_09740 [Blautia sp.]|nr:hypothetical protein [Blautia sp.]